MKKPVFLALCILMVLLVSSTVHSVMQVQNFELSSEGDDEKIKPMEEVTIDYDVVNMINETYEDTQLEMWFESSSGKLKDADGESMIYTNNLRDLDAGEEKGITYKFLVPFDVKDGEKFTIKVKIKGKNAGTKIRETYQYDVGEFRVSKESDDVYVNASFVPSSVDCQKYVQLNIYLRNTGTNDQDVNLTAINKVIGADIREKFFLDRDYDVRENVFQRSYNIQLNPNINPGTYELGVNANFDSGYANSYKTIKLEVKPCIGGQTSQPGTQTGGQTNQTTTTTQPTQTTGGQTGTTTKPATMPISARPGQSSGSLFGNTGNLILIISGEILIVLLVVVVFLVIWKKRQKQEPQQMY